MPQLGLSVMCPGEYVVWERVPQCRVRQYGRVFPSVGGCVPVLCVCEVWVSLSHVDLMMDSKCICASSDYMTPCLRGTS